MKDIHRMLPFTEFDLQQETKPVSAIEAAFNLIRQDMAPKVKQHFDEDPMPCRHQDLSPAQELPLSCHHNCARAVAQQGTYNPTCLSYPERRCAEATKLMFPIKAGTSADKPKSFSGLEDCYCFEGHCRGGETVKGRLASGLLCKREKTK